MSIRKQIKECALFLPVISASTQAREEGYFRLEWKLAIDRSYLMADDKPFPDSRNWGRPIEKNIEISKAIKAVNAAVGHKVLGDERVDEVIEWQKKDAIEKQFNPDGSGEYY